MSSAIQVASFGFIRMCLFQILTWQFLRFREGGYRTTNRYVQKELAIIVSQSETEVLPEVGVGFLEVPGVGLHTLWKKNSIFVFFKEIRCEKWRECYF